MIGLIIPPGQIKKLLQKTAEHVALNGSEFQRILIERQQQKPQFAFLKVESPYRAYYDHRVAQISKKLIQGITSEDPLEQAKVEVVALSNKEQEEAPQQPNFLEKIFIELKEPDPEKYIAELPEKLSEAQQAIIQHTAQYAAKNGKNFLVALSEREKNNPQFQFLRASSKSHIYFTKMVQAYTNILEIENEQLERLSAYLQSRQQIFDTCRTVYDYHLSRQQQARGKKEQQTKQIKDSNIDWNDFELVDTITFDTEQNKNIANGELLARIQQHASMVPRSMEEKIISEPKKREFLQQCHACRQNILASQMNKHLKTCLGQKKKVQSATNGQGEDVDIRKNLQSLSVKRPDIFGAVQNKITLHQEQDGSRERVIFDGQAANLTRTTGSIAMLQYQQKKLKEEQEKREK